MKDYGAELFGVDEDTKEITPVGKKGYGVFIYGIMKYIKLEKRDLKEHVLDFVKVLNFYLCTFGLFE